MSRKPRPKKPNFSIEISEEFKQRFPEGERELACACAKQILLDIIDEKTTIGSTDRIKQHLKNPTDDLPLKLKASGTLDIAHYFDDRAILRFNYKGDTRVGTAMHVLSRAHWFRNNSLGDLRDIVVNHPFINDELGNGTFATPLRIATTTPCWPMVGLLSENPNVNPNIANNDGRFDGISRTADHLAYATIRNFSERHKNKTLLELLIDQHKDETSTTAPNRSAPETPMTEVMKRFIDNGAIIYDAVREGLNGKGLVEVKEYVNAIQTHLDSVDPETCTVQDIKHAYGARRLTPWFEQAMEDPGTRIHLLKLEHELPGWLQSELEPAYSILNAERWTIRSQDTGERGGWNIGGDEEE